MAQTHPVVDDAVAITAEVEYHQWFRTDPRKVGCADGDNRDAGVEVSNLDTLPNHHRVQTALTGVILSGFLPFVVLHFSHLWRYRPHYEFFPFVLVAALALITVRWPREGAAETAVSKIVGWGMLLFGFLVLGVATLLFSPLVATAGLVIATGGFLVLWTGAVAFEQLLGPWCLLWLIVPPPFRLDDDLIRWLQGTTAEMASAVLEYLNVPHVLAGYVFQLPGRELFVSEACSGVHFQFVLIAACWILSVMARRTLVHTVLLTLSAFFWSIAANSARVSIVVYAAARHEIDLAHGWTHDLLGYGVAVCGFLMVLASDRCLTGLLFAFEKPEGILEKRWNRWIAGERRKKKSIETPPASLPASSLPRAALLLLGGVSLVLGVLQIATISLTHVRFTSRLTRLSDEIAADWLTPPPASWQIDDYTVGERDAGSEFGQFTNRWRCRSSTLQASFQVDYPFIDWHELSWCYVSTGWQVESRSVVSNQTEGKAEGQAKEFVTIDFVRPSGARGLLLFGLCEPSGELIGVSNARIGSLWDQFKARPLLVLLNDDGWTVRQASVETVQLQLFATSPGRFSAAQREHLQSLYLHLQRQIRDRLALSVNEAANGGSD